MSEFRTVGRHTLIYGIGVVASKLVSFIMLPVYTRYLTPSDYGVIELLSMTIDLIGMIAGVGLAGGVFKHYAEAPTPRAKRELMSTVALATLGISFLVMAAGIAAAPWLTRLVLGPEHPALYFRLFFVTYFLQSFGGVALMYVRAEERSRLFVGVNLARLVVSLALAILFVVHLRMGVTGVLLGTLVTAGLSFVGLAAYLFGRVGLHFVLDRFASLSRFGAPIVVWTVGSFILTFSDRYFLEHYRDTAAVGIYSLAYKFSFLLSSFAVVPFTEIWEPRRFAIAQQPDAGSIYRRMFLYFNLAMFAGAIGLLLFIRDGLTLLVGPDFVSAYRVVPLLLATTIVQQWTGYCNLGLFIGNDTRRYGVAALIGVVAALIGNFVFIPRYGIMGAAVATVIAYVVRFVPVYLWAQARYRIDYPWRDVGLLVGLFIAVWGLRAAMDVLPFWPSLLGSTVLACAIGGAMYARLLDPPAREFVRRQIRRPLAVLSGRTA